MPGTGANLDFYIALVFIVAGLFEPLAAGHRFSQDFRIEKCCPYDVAWRVKRIGPFQFHSSFLLTRSLRVTWKSIEVSTTIDQPWLPSQPRDTRYQKLSYLDVYGCWKHKDVSTNMTYITGIIDRTAVARIITQAKTHVKLFGSTRSLEETTF
jgi:hypothetical protein